jgi:hypothetical protein
MPSVTRARVVDEPDPKALGLDDLLGRQDAAERRVVHVPVDGLDGAELAQIFEHGGGREVADVEDEIGGLEEAEALVGKPPRAARQVGVADERDQRRSSRNRPSRYTSSPSA